MCAYSALGGMDCPPRLLRRQDSRFLLRSSHDSSNFDFADGNPCDDHAHSPRASRRGRSNRPRSGSSARLSLGHAEHFPSPRTSRSTRPAADANLARDARRSAVVFLIRSRRGSGDSRHASRKVDSRACRLRHFAPQPPDRTASGRHSRNSFRQRIDSAGSGR